MGTYGLRVPASRVGYVPDAQGGLPPGPLVLYVRGTRTSLGRWARTARRGTPGALANPNPNPNPNPNQVRSRSTEPLDCDGECGKQVPRGDALWSCGVCDFDLCEPVP